MEIIKYPSEKEVQEAIAQKEPLLVLISFDGKTVIMSHIDEAVEHYILLMKAGFSDKDIDKFFRIVLDDEGADWTFVCPPDYKNIVTLCFLVLRETPIFPCGFYLVITAPQTK